MGINPAIIDAVVDAIYDGGTHQVNEFEVYKMDVNGVPFIVLAKSGEAKTWLHISDLEPSGICTWVQVNIAKMS